MLSLHQNSAQRTSRSGTPGLHLKRDVFVVVSIKILIVLSAAWFVFGSAKRPRIDDVSVRDRLLENSLSQTGSLPK